MVTNSMSLLLKKNVYKVATERESGSSFLGNGFKEQGFSETATNNILIFLQPSLKPVNDFVFGKI